MVPLISSENRQMQQRPKIILIYITLYIRVKVLHLLALFLACSLTPPHIPEVGATSSPTTFLGDSKLAFVL